MREIRFRAWDGKQMYKPESLVQPFGDSLHVGYQDDSGCPKYLDDPVMEYTGLQDKNGVRIYEGDVFAKSKDSQQKYVVYYDSLYTQFKIRHYVLEIDTDGEEYYQLKDFRRQLRETMTYNTVIGNIYENPELLEK